MNLQDLQEAYNQVHQLDEAVKGESSERRRDLAAQRREGHRPLSPSKGRANVAKMKQDIEYFDKKNTNEEYIDEAEGSYGQTPKATSEYGKLANKRRETPASEYSERGEKTKKVKSAEKNFHRTLNPDAGNRGKKSSKPSVWSGKRSGMTQKDRDEARGGDEYGHTAYDSDFHGGPSAPGGKPKGKKAERQKKTGVSAESFNAYESVLSYLIDEGFASTEESADKIILNMSESWFEEIMESRRMDKEGVDRGDSLRASRKERAEKSLEAVKKGEERKVKVSKKYGIPVSDKDTVEKQAHKRDFSGSRQEPKVKGEKETSDETQRRRVNRENERKIKHGFTKKEKKDAAGYAAHENDYKKSYGQNKSAWD